LARGRRSCRRRWSGSPTELRLAGRTLNDLPRRVVGQAERLRTSGTGDPHRRHCSGNDISSRAATVAFPGRERQQETLSESAPTDTLEECCVFAIATESLAPLPP
jgi:hypothetical protein